MTNVDFFSLFAAHVDADPVQYISIKQSAYHFEHDVELQNASIFMSEDVASDDTGRKMFHFTNPDGIKTIYDETGNVDGVKYSGSIMVLVKADLEQTIFDQSGTGTGDRYLDNVKPMIDKGGVIKEIHNFTSKWNNTELDLTGESVDQDFGTYVTITTGGVTEVFAEMDLNGDGIVFGYEMTIKHDPKA